MVHCPIFLKGKKGLPAGRQGISFIELLIVLVFIGAMAVFLMVALNPAAQMGKARDARRKSDLSKLKNVLEDYYNDKNSYPSTLTCGASLAPYLAKIPCDPLYTDQSYAYIYPSGGDKYRIYVKLEYGKDPSIAEAACEDGCGPGCAYNFGVSSSNISLESCTVCADGCYGCQGPACNVVTGDFTGPKYYNDPCCGGNCCGPAGCPVVCSP